MNRIKKILLIDDDPDDRFIFSEVLKRIDKKVECTYAIDGEEALKLLRDDKNPSPDIIFLDLNMPRMSGKQCLAEIRRLNGYSRVPIIILTTSDWHGDIADVTENGASYFLTKSSFKELIECISFLLNEPEDKENTSPERLLRLQKMLRKLND